jgi:hypothetical protein
MTYAINIYMSDNNWRQTVSARFGDMPSKRLTGTATYNPPSLSSGAFSTATTVTVTGALVGQPAQASFSLNTQGVQFNAWVSAADTVSVILTNPTSGTIDLASGTLTAFSWVP